MIDISTFRKIVDHVLGGKNISSFDKEQDLTFKHHNRLKNQLIIEHILDSKPLEPYISILYHFP